MKTDPLLDAVFNPGDDSLRPVLAAARRRRVRRVFIRVAGTAACVAAIAWLAIPRPLSRPSTSGENDRIAETSPAIPHPALAPSTPKPAFETISSRPLATSDVIHTESSGVLVISTESKAPPPPRLADAELLALFDSGRVALVGTGAQRRLVTY